MFQNACISPPSLLLSKVWCHYNVLCGTNHTYAHSADSVNVRFLKAAICNTYIRLFSSKYNNYQQNVKKFQF